MQVIQTTQEVYQEKFSCAAGCKHKHTDISSLSCYKAISLSKITFDIDFRLWIVVS